LAPVLIGRESECARLDELLDRARMGRSGALAIRGEPGIGKTALLAYAEEKGEGMTVVRALGIESEAELEFSALLDVCRPLLGYLTEIPEHQAEALRAALDLGPAVTVDRFAIGAATLGVLAAAAEVNPLLVLVDDAQWLDPSSADALLFATRRLDADRVMLIFGARDGEKRSFDAPGVESISLTGLEQEAATRLLRGQVEAAPEVADLLYEATGGNPLALIELPSLLSAEQLRGREPFGEPLPVGSSIERAFTRRADALPEESRMALLLACVSTSHASDAVLAALRARGLGPSTLEAAEDAGLLKLVDGRLEFRHPLVRSAVYQAAAPSERRAAHRALADACAESEPEEAAWHLAAAALGPDENAASALAAAASRTRDRSGYLGASEGYERSARLTPDRALRLHRLADAAETAWSGGASERAAELAVEVLAECDDAGLSARLLRLQGRVELQAGTPARARELFLDAASLVEEPSSAEAITTLGLAIFACQFEGRIAEALEVARRVRERAPRDGGVTDLQADYVLGRSLLLAGALDEGVPVLERVVRQLVQGDDVPRTNFARAATALTVLERGAETRALVERATRLAREEGPMALLYALTLSAELDVRHGQWQRAVAAALEGIALARELDQPNIVGHFLVSLAYVHAARGDEQACRDAAKEALLLLGHAGMALVSQQVRCSLGRLELGLDRLEDAVEVLELSAATLADMGVYDRDVVPVPDLVEALVRLARRDEAGRALEAWLDQGVETRTIFGPALAARCRGLLVGEDFDDHFLYALAQHGRFVDPYNEARTRLCFGERLRRAGRRVDARRELKAALEVFEGLEAEPWILRTRRELRASGEKLGRRSPVQRDELTAQEGQIALQVAEGKTNKEVGAALFLSSKTVEFHLSRIYRKLDISSRAELIRRYAAEGLPAVAAMG